MNHIISVTGLKKQYGVKGVVAVDGVDLYVDEGEVFGLLGPNGAGKTTIMKVLTTLLKPTAGNVEILGYGRTQDDAKIRNCIGYVPQDVSSDPALTGYENILISSKLYGKSGGESRRLADSILSELGLTESAHRMVKTYSGGMIRKLEIGQALVHRPKLMFLDEPTVGLDPRARKSVWEQIRRIRKEMNMTVVLTTHYMDEADSICDRIAIMSIGRISVVGTPAGLKKSVGMGAVVLRVNGKIPEIPGIMRDGDSVILPAEQPEMELPRIVKIFNDNGCEVLSAKTRDVTLDDVFVKYAGSSMEEMASWQSTRKVRRVARRLE